MGLLQTAYRTYENHASLVGVAVDEKEPLSPVSHAVMKAQITITLNDDGAFAGCEKIPRESCRTIIPVTEKSIGRVGDNNCPHPLCDQLRYLSPEWESKYNAYLEQLRAWASSAYTHPILKAVLRYIEKGTILADLSREGLIRLDEAGMPEKGGIEGQMSGALACSACVRGVGRLLDKPEAVSKLDGLLCLFADRQRA